MRPDGTHLKVAITDERGSAQLEQAVTEPVTIYCSRPKFRHYLSERTRLNGVFKIALHSRGDGGSVIFLDGTGYIPGLEGRLNPILDSVGRTYVYAENIAIDRGEAQPVPFVPNRAFTVRDRHGASFELTVISIIGSSSLIDYARKPHS